MDVGALLLRDLYPRRAGLLSRPLVLWLRALFGRPGRRLLLGLSLLRCSFGGLFLRWLSLLGGALRLVLGGGFLGGTLRPFSFGSGDFSACPFVGFSVGSADFWALPLGAVSLGWFCTAPLP